MTDTTKKEEEVPLEDEKTSSENKEADNASTEDAPTPEGKTETEADENIETKEAPTSESKSDENKEEDEEKNLPKDGEEAPASDKVDTSSATKVAAEGASSETDAAEASETKAKTNDTEDPNADSKDPNSNLYTVAGTLYKESLMQDINVSQKSDATTEDEKTPDTVVTSLTAEDIQRLGLSGQDVLSTLEPGHPLLTVNHEERLKSIDIITSKQVAAFGNGGTWQAEGQFDTDMQGADGEAKSGDNTSFSTISSSSNASRLAKLPKDQQSLLKNSKYSNVTLSSIKGSESMAQKANITGEGNLPTAAEEVDKINDKNILMQLASIQNRSAGADVKQQRVLVTLLQRNLDMKEKLREERKKLEKEEEAFMKRYKDAAASFKSSGISSIFSTQTPSFANLLGQGSGGMSSTDKLIQSLARSGGSNPMGMGLSNLSSAPLGSSSSTIGGYSQSMLVQSILGKGSSSTSMPQGLSVSSSSNGGVSRAQALALLQAQEEKEKQVKMKSLNGIGSDLSNSFTNSAQQALNNILMQNKQKNGNLQSDLAMSLKQQATLQAEIMAKMNGLNGTKRKDPLSLLNPEKRQRL
eukprot:g823.t1